MSITIRFLLLYLSLFFIATQILQDSALAESVSCQGQTHCAILCNEKQGQLNAEAEQGESWSCAMIEIGTVVVSGPEDEAADEGQHTSYECNCTKLVVKFKKRGGGEGPSDPPVIRPPTGGIDPNRPTDPYYECLEKWDKFHEECDVQCEEDMEIKYPGEDQKKEREDEIYNCRKDVCEETYYKEKTKCFDLYDRSRNTMKFRYNKVKIKLPGDD